MPLTILDIATDLDSHVIYANSGRTAQQTAYLVNSINAGLEDLRAHSPQSFRQTLDVVWNHGVGVTTSVSGSSLGPDASLAGYAAGCTVNIGGDQTYNELATIGDGTSAASLLFPYTGTAGSQNLTIWRDCVKLGAAVDHVVGGFLLHERRPLDILNSRAEWLLYQRFYDYGVNDYGNNQVVRTITRRPEVPRGLWLETVLNGNEIEYRARCAPLPNGDYRATLEVQSIADSITANDISASSTATVTGDPSPDSTGEYEQAGTFNDAPFYLNDQNYVLFFTGTAWIIQLFSHGLIGGANNWNFSTASTSPAGDYNHSGSYTGSATVAVSGVSTRPVPGHRVYTILRALCLYHWSSCPWFHNQQALAGINQGYTNAVEQLRGFRNNRSASPVSRVQY